MKHPLSKRKFVYCSLHERDIPIEDDLGCCSFYDLGTNKCDYNKYSSKIEKRRISQREENYEQFSGRDESDF